MHGIEMRPAYLQLGPEIRQHEARVLKFEQRLGMAWFLAMRGAAGGELSRMQIVS